MAARPGPGGMIALGGDDGSVRLLAVRPASLASAATVRMSPAGACGAADGRVVSLCWHPKGSGLVTGTDSGVLRVWDVAVTATSTSEASADSRVRPECPHRLVVAGAVARSGQGAARGRRGARKAEVSTRVVWGLAVLDDWTVAAADSEGDLTLWDGARGVLVQRVAAHDGDATAVVADTSAGSPVLLSVGVDGRLVACRRTETAWAAVARTPRHAADARAIAAHAGTVVTGAADGSVTLSPLAAGPGSTVDLSSPPVRPSLVASSSAPGSTRILVGDPSAPGAGLWRLPALGGGSAALPGRPSLVARVAGPAGDGLTAAAVSPCGAAVALAFTSGVHVVAVPDGARPSSAVLPPLGAAVTSLSLRATPAGFRLAAAHADGRLAWADVSPASSAAAVWAGSRAMWAAAEAAGAPSPAPSSSAAPAGKRARAASASSAAVSAAMAPAECCCFSADGLVACASPDGRSLVLVVSTDADPAGRVLHIPAIPSAVAAVALAPAAPGAGTTALAATNSGRLFGFRVLPGSAEPALEDWCPPEGLRLGRLAAKVLASPCPRILSLPGDASKGMRLVLAGASRLVTVAVAGAEPPKAGRSKRSRTPDVRVAESSVDVDAVAALLLAGDGSVCVGEVPAETAERMAPAAVRTRKFAV